MLEDSIRASASPVRWMAVEKPPGLVIPWPDFCRWFAYRRHSSRVNLDATPHKPVFVCILHGLFLLHILYCAQILQGLQLLLGLQQMQGLQFLLGPELA